MLYHHHHGGNIRWLYHSHTPRGPCNCHDHHGGHVTRINIMGAVSHCHGAHAIILTSMEAAYHHTIPVAVACSPAWSLHHPPHLGSRAAHLPARLLSGASPPSQEQNHRAAQGIPSWHCPRSCHTPGAVARIVSMTPHFSLKTTETHYVPSSSSSW